MTRCKKVDSKSDKIKILLFQNHAFCKSFSFKIMLFRKIFFRIVFLKIARNTQKMRIFRGKLNQNVLLCVQHFFQNLLSKINFFFRIVLFKIARITQKMCNLPGKLNQNVIFCAQDFFQNLLFKINFFFKIVPSENFFFQNHAF